jgi:hypothetical protein
VLSLALNTPVAEAQSAPATSAANPDAPATPQPPPADPAQKPAAPAKPKHVITNDDIDPHPTTSRDGKIVTGDNSSLLNCDATCEQEARNDLGYDSDYEAEWRVQIVKARQDLIDDSAWRGMLSQAIQQTDNYCNFLLQQTQQTAPSGNDYRSKVLQSKNAQYFENMDRTLRQGLQTTMNHMQDHLREVQTLSPVRAALMYVQGERIFSRNCEFPGKQ